MAIQSFTLYASVGRCAPLTLCCPAPLRDRLRDKSGQSGAEADVVVDVGAGVVAVQVENTGVGTVVPVATTPSKAPRLTAHPPMRIFYLVLRFHPFNMRPISLNSLLHSS